MPWEPLGRILLKRGFYSRICSLPNCRLLELSLYYQERRRGGKRGHNGELPEGQRTRVLRLQTPFPKVLQLNLKNAYSLEEPRKVKDWGVMVLGSPMEVCGGEHREEKLSEALSGTS